ncbi:MAG TPA: alpha/beta hydrolase [Nonomuraea sp.]|nr:alpha/beta hydrolase [Nonomuraea sp.]
MLLRELGGGLQQSGPVSLAGFASDRPRWSRRHAGFLPLLTTRCHNLLSELMDPRARVIRLGDGRSLGMYEFGDLTGRPCLYIPGTPASGLAGAAYSEAARVAGVHLIALDKPGYGRSDLVSPRTLRAFARDVAAVARALDMPRLCVFGESGGGPQALAAAALMSGQVALTVIAAGTGPVDEPAMFAGMKPSNRRLLRVARHAPFLLRPPMALTRRSLLNPTRREAFVQAQLAAAGPADRRAIEQMAALFDVTAAAADALRAGTKAVAVELAMLARPWDFDLADVTGRVELWHGADDVNVPPAVALLLAHRLPNAVAHVLPGEGHAVGWSRRQAIMASLSGAELAA